MRYDIGHHSDVIYDIFDNAHWKEYVILIFLQLAADFIHHDCVFHVCCRTSL